MSSQKAEEVKVPEGRTEGPEGRLDDASVVRYLEADPSFFVRHPELAARLRIPHAPQGTLSLVEHQLSVLRSQLDTERRRLSHLIARAREYETLSARLHLLVLKLITAPDIEAVEATLSESLSKDFVAEAVTLKLFSVETASPGDPLVGAFLEFVERKHALCGPLDPERNGALFGDDSAKIKSAALIPIRGEVRSGVLAIGSADPERFAPDMGTEHLDRLGEVVSRKLAVIEHARG